MPSFRCGLLFSSTIWGICLSFRANSKGLVGTSSATLALAAVDVPMSLSQQQASGATVRTATDSGVRVRGCSDRMRSSRGRQVDVPVLRQEPEVTDEIEVRRAVFEFVKADDFGEIPLAVAPQHQ